MNALIHVKLFFRKIWLGMAENTEYAEKQFITLGVIGVIGYSSYYIIWHEITPDAYNSLTLRLIAILLCLGLIFKNYWPDKLRKITPLYWYFTLFYLFPFFFSFLTLKNNFNDVWVLNSMIALFCLVILTNWISLIALLFAGITCAWLLYFLTTPITYLPNNLTMVVVTYTSVLTTGGLFIYNKDTFLKEKLEAMRNLAVDIAHELRTPLAAISMAAEGTKEYLPDLLETYKLATEAKLPTPDIRPSQFKLLSSALDSVTAEVNYSNTIINMLLVNAEQMNINPGEFKHCSISKCVEEALQRYPFQSDEKQLVHWDNKNNFHFMGTEILTIHMLFNLLKNSVYYIRAAHKGDIHIWLELGETFNTLHFRDTAKGIAPDILPKIFDLFFSRTYHGSGIGLAFCKMVMQSYGGKIECESVEGEFAEFILSFPVSPLKTL